MAIRIPSSPFVDIPHFESAWENSPTPILVPVSIRTLDMRRPWFKLN